MHGSLKALLPNVMIGTVSARTIFSEQFDAGWEQRWVKSDEVVKGGNKGEWIVSAGDRWVKHAEEEHGLMTHGDLAFYGISASFDSVSNIDKALIIQYQVKHGKAPNCGGAFLKVGPSLADPKHFGDPSPFHIMFGPDTCGPSSQRTQLIFALQGRAELKKDDLPYKQGDGLSHLYRMTLLPDNTVSVDIDQENVYQGSLSEDWEFAQSDDLYRFDDIGYVGFDLWQMQGGTIFDNIIITDDVVEADEMAQKWHTLHPLEVQALGVENSNGVGEM